MDIRLILIGQAVPVRIKNHRDAMDDEFPVIPGSSVSVAIVFHSEGPVSCGIFIPIVYGGEHPIAVVVATITLFLRQRAARARGRGQCDDEIAAIDMIDVDDDFDVFHLQSIVDGHRIIQSLRGIVRNGRIDCTRVACDVDGRCDVGPILCDSHRTPSIHSAKSILVRDIMTRPIDIP